MKTFNLFLFILTASLLLTASSCEKESPEDPRFSCKINGELWNPKDGNFSFGLTANYDYDPSIGRDVFSINAAQHDHPTYIEVGVLLEKPKSGTYTGNSIKSINLLKKNFALYFLDTMRIFKINLNEFDTHKRIAKGTFEGFLTDIHYPSEGFVHITEGKFNVKF